MHANRPEPAAVVSARARPRGRDVVAVRRAASRRDPAPACRRDPLASIRATTATARRGCVCSTCRPTRPGPRSPSPSTDSSARRSKRGRRSGPRSPSSPTARPASWPTCCSPTVARRSAASYINRVLVPLLCRKAGVPREDVRGAITGHRARATIATQLYNAKDPMSLFELQAWLGHSNAELDPALRADHPDHPDQGLHRRRVLRAERPHDRGAPRPRRDHQRPEPARAARSSSTTSGTATAPTASSSNARTGWRAPAATSTSPRRQARRSCSKPRTGCSGCSSQIPLTDKERAAVEGDQDAVDRLIDRLADTQHRRAPHHVTSMPAPRRPGSSSMSGTRTGLDADC